MTIDDGSRRRYARHLLLAEVGERGQALLSARAVSVAGDARAAEVASLYLGRAGVTVQADAADVVDAGAPEVVRAFAGRPELEQAAAFVAGAFAAVESIKRILGAGDPGALPASLVPSWERR